MLTENDRKLPPFIGFLQKRIVIQTILTNNINFITVYKKCQIITLLYQRIQLTVHNMHTKQAYIYIKRLLE
jgi:hypothetical protein